MNEIVFICFFSFFNDFSCCVKGMDFEKEGCAAAPWAHNAFVDETYSPMNGIYYQTHPNDRSAIAIK